MAIVFCINNLLKQKFELDLYFMILDNSTKLGTDTSVCFKVIIWKTLREYNNKMCRRMQFDMTAEVEPWTVGASLDTPFRLDTALYHFHSLLFVCQRNACFWPLIPSIHNTKNRSKQSLYSMALCTAVSRISIHSLLSYCTNITKIGPLFINSSSNNLHNRF